MPKIPIDYSKCVIYKLCCNDTTIKDEYYGHTTDKTKRKSKHKSGCNNLNDKQYNLYVYQMIRQNGGWDNWSMIVVEEYPCENRNQAELRERYWIETQQATLNTNIPTRSRIEWYEEHKEEIIERNAQYYQEHREEMLERQKQYNKQHREERLEKHKQYYQEHREERLEQQKQYREEHKEEYKKRQYQKFNCECGGKYTYSHKSSHLKSQKHLRYLEQNNV